MIIYCKEDRWSADDKRQVYGRIASVEKYVHKTPKRGVDVLVFLTSLVDEAERTSFSELYYGYRVLLLRVARSFFPEHPDRAEEAVQEAFVQCAKNFQKISSLPCETIAPYLVTIVKNTSRDLMRREKKYAPPLEEDQPSPWDLTPRTAGLAEAYRRAVELIGTLPERYRCVLECRLVLELSNRETARRLHLRENTVSVRFARGRELLSKQLKEEGHGLE